MQFILSRTGVNMNIRNKIVSKLSTIDAGRTIFFIVAGLGIKESLTLFSPVGRPEWGGTTRLIIVAGYLITTVRFSHAAAMICGNEHERIKKTNLPTSRRIAGFSLLLILSSIYLFLMAVNITEFKRYSRHFLFFIIVNTVMLWISKTVANPLNWRPHMGISDRSRIKQILINLLVPLRMYKRQKQTADGYLSRSVMNWIILNILSFVAYWIFYFWSRYWTNDYALNEITFNIGFGVFLFVFGVADYWQNRSFYFGDKDKLRKNRFVFVCSPFSGTTDAMRDNLKLAQFYCYKLLSENISLPKVSVVNTQKYPKNPKGASKDRSFFANAITPFASHCFFPYFLGRSQKEQSILRECSLAYLRACDSIYLYRRKEDGDDCSQGMRHKIEEAEEMGIEMRTMRRLSKPEDDFDVTDWKPFDEELLRFLDREYLKKKDEGSIYFDGSRLRKRVYVCTHLRGKKFDTKGLGQKIEILQANVRKSLWYCRALAKKESELISPFAPQAFYPYFWKFLKEDGTTDKVLWDTWFDSSLKVLGICDAVYIYTKDGLPNLRDLSRGMEEVLSLSKKLGIEIRYVQDQEVPALWNPVLPEFK